MVLFVHFAPVSQNIIKDVKSVIDRVVGLLMSILVTSSVIANAQTK